jgi:uncharacterized protein (TIGR03435 family)
MVITSMKQTFFLLGVAITLANSPAACGQSSDPKVGDRPPPLKLNALLQAPDEAKASWDALKGKVVVLEFWATWCGPCVAAISHLNELAEQFKDRPVQFIAITDEDEKIIDPFLKKKPMQAWVGLDTDKSMFKDYGIKGIPHTVVVDKNGKIAAIIHPTRLTGQILQEVLAGKKPALAQSTEEGAWSISAGEVPYESDRAKPSLFQVLIRPSSADAQNHIGMSSGNGSLTISGSSVFNVLSSCYGISPVRILTNCILPAGPFDFVVKTPSKDDNVARNWLRQAVETTFGLGAKRQTNQMDVFLLSVAKPDADGLAPTVSNGGSSSSSGPGRIQAINAAIESLAVDLENRLGKPVIDETGLTNHYDFELKWKDEGDKHSKSGVLVRAIREQLGLELKAAKRPVEVLVVDRVAK